MKHRVGQVFAGALIGRVDGNGRELGWGRNVECFGHGDERLRAGGLVNGQRDVVVIDLTQIDTAAQGGINDRLGLSRDVERQRVEVVGVDDGDATGLQRACQRCGAPVDTDGDLAESVRAVIDGVHPGDDREEHLGGADVAGCLLPSDVLLAGLQGEPERGLALIVNGDTDEAARE